MLLDNPRTIPDMDGKTSMHHHASPGSIILVCAAQTLGWAEANAALEGVTAGGHRRQRWARLRRVVLESTSIHFHLPSTPRFASPRPPAASHCSRVDESVREIK